MPQEQPQRRSLDAPALKRGNGPDRCSRTRERLAVATRRQRLGVGPAVALALVLSLVPSHAEEKSVRTESEVRARARHVLEAYSDPLVADLGYLDATKAPYAADPTGQADATAAIRLAIEDARDAQLTCYLPAGTYRVSDTIVGTEGVILWDHWPHEGHADPWVAERSFYYPCIIAGPAQGARAKIRLADNAPGFDDPKHPKPVVFFWARDSTDKPDVVRHNISFNQQIRHLDFDLGEGNPGAVAIRHRGAEGSTIEDVAIRAAGAFAGIHDAPGSGGAIHGVSVTGGQYGLYITGAQPSPLVSDVTLCDQTEYAILYAERGPLTIVGANIEGAGIIGKKPASPWDGAISIVDSVIRLKHGDAAIRSERSLVLENVHVHNAPTIASVDDFPPLTEQPSGWTHVRRYAVGGRVTYPKTLGGIRRREEVWCDGEALGARAEAGPTQGPPPDQLLGPHRRPREDSWNDPGTSNARSEPFGANGDGIADDTAAIQAAIDAGKPVFLPKGVYRISSPLTLGPGTRLFGCSALGTVITPIDGAPAFADPNNPQPLIDTANEPHASTRLELLTLELPVRNPCVYALRWRAGHNSLVRNVYPIRTPWHPDAPSYGIPMVRIEGQGGGRWYTQTLLHWWSQLPPYRHLLVQGTRQPLRFYHLQPQHARGLAQVEMRDCKNIDIFSMKSEGDVPMLWLQDCRNVRVFGVGGIIAPFPGQPIICMERCNDVLLANVQPQIADASRWSALGIQFDPKRWFILRDDERQLGALESFALWMRGDPTGN